MLALKLMLIILLAGHQVNSSSVGRFARQSGVFQHRNQSKNQEENYDETEDENQDDTEDINQDETEDEYQDDTEDANQDQDETEDADQDETEEEDQDEDEDEFEICPDHHPWTFDNGAQCCKDRNLKASVYKAPTKCDDAVPCGDWFCENHHNPCVFTRSSGKNVIILSGFNDTSVDGYYAFNHSDAAYESNEPIFRRQDSVASCIWWHRPYRHWWVGSCENIGQNAGFAYIAPDLQCPVTLDKPYWRRGGSDKVLRGTDASFAVFSSAAAGLPTTENTGSVGLNAIVRNGRYRQTCRFRLVASQWRCI